MGIACNFGAVDFETANTRPDSACAVGLVVVRADRIHTWGSLIRPPTRDFWFTNIHGLTWQDVRSAPLFADLWARLSAVFASLDFLAAHNARFDRRVLDMCCRRYGLAPPRQRFFCTVNIARDVWGIRPTKLPDVCRALGIPLRHHDARSDALACARIVLAALRRGWRP